MGQYSGYAGYPAEGDTTCLPSQNLWSKVDACERKGLWFDDFEDFVCPPYTETLPTTEDPYFGWRCFTSTGGVCTEQDLEGGVRILGSDGDDEGSAIARGSYPYKIIQNAGELVYECRIKITTITADLMDCFCGLFENDALDAATPVTATQGTLADNNCVGFLHDSTTATTAATMNFTYKADGVTAVDIGTIGAGALAADTWIKLGMTFNRGGDNVLRYYVNGLEQTATKAIPSDAGTDFPNDVRLGWCFGVTNTAATTDRLYVDWVRCAQRRVTSIP